MKKPFTIKTEEGGVLYHCKWCDSYLHQDLFYESTIEEKRHRCRECSKRSVNDYRQKKKLKKENVVTEKKKRGLCDFVCRHCGEEDVNKFPKSASNTRNWICKQCTKDKITEYGKMMRYLKLSSPNPKTLMTEDDIQYLFEKVWKGKCVISGKEGNRKKLAFVHLNPNEEMSAWNVILVDKVWANFFKTGGHSFSLIPLESKRKIKKKLEKVKSHYEKTEPWILFK